MRLVQVAKVLGMTGQQLRKELLSVDFGVKPTDREIPDNLALGVIRYVARVHGIEVDMDALGMDSDGLGASEEKKATTDEAEESAEEGEAEVSEAAPAPAKEVNVLRKLTLEGVSKDAIAKQEKKLKMESAPAARKPERRDRPAPVKHKASSSHQEQIKKKEGIVFLPAQISVKEFAEKTGVQVPQVIQSLMQNGMMVTITQSIDFDTAAIIAAELGVTVQKQEDTASAEHLMSGNLKELLTDDVSTLVPRPPIVVVMGHVDHGKTSILDAIRQTDVVKGEAGGITQHIGAYQVEHVSKGSKEVHKITFLDTPGHEAFTAMRARGAQVTDIVILVVAADEGVKPTTIEAINHAKEAGVPILVAMNKIDKPNADPDRVKGELAGYGIQADDWGGSVPFVNCSATTKQGIDDLLDSVVLMSQMAELKANPNRSAVATVVESNLDQSHGALATVIVNAGTMHVGDIFVCGTIMGKVRTMIDSHGKRLSEAGLSAALRISGFNAVPAVGDILQVVPTEQKARQLMETMQAEGAKLKKKSFADLVSRLSAGKLKQLKIVLKADAQGSLDAIRDSLNKRATEEVSVKVIHAAIGSVTETDVMMASASEGIVVAFHAEIPPAVERAAEREGVKVREYDIIYNLLDDVDGLLKGLVEPVEEEKILGHLEVKGVFMTKKNEQVIGGRVADGTIKRLPFRLQRSGEEVGTGRITSLRKVDKDIKEATEGTECGMRVESTVPVVEGDVLEVYLREFKKKA